MSLETKQTLCQTTCSPSVLFSLLPVFPLKRAFSAEYFGDVIIARCLIVKYISSLKDLLPLQERLLKHKMSPLRVIASLLGRCVNERDPDKVFLARRGIKNQLRLQGDSVEQNNPDQFSRSGTAEVMANELANVLMKTDHLPEFDKAIERKNRGSSSQKVLR